MKVYLQFADGQEHELHTTEPDPDDGSYCVHFDDFNLPTDLPISDWWIRICPNDYVFPTTAAD